MSNKPQFVGECRRVKLGDICDIRSGGTPKRSVTEYWDNGTIPWVKIGDITNKHVSSTEERITEAGLKGSSAKMLEPGTLLYSIFASIGAVGILDIRAATNQAIAGLTITSNVIERDYLYHFLKSQEALAKSSGRGAAQSNINLTILKGLVVPVPSLSAQRSIVAQLESVSAQIDRAEQQIDKLDSLVKSRFVEMFGETPNASKYEIRQVGSIADVFVGVVVKPKQYYSDDPENAVKAFRSLNVGEMTVRDDDWVYFTHEGNRKASKSVLKGGDVLVVRSGYPGTSCVVPAEYEGSNAIDLIIARVVSQKIRPEFLAAFNNSDYVKNLIASTSVGSAQKHFNVGFYKRVELSLPPIETQDEFIVFQRQVDKSRFVAQQQIEKLQMLYDSLAQDYFG